MRAALRLRGFLVALALVLGSGIPAWAANPTNVSFYGTLNAACATQTGCAYADSAHAGSVLFANITPPAQVTIQISGTFAGTVQIEGSADCQSFFTPVGAFGSTYSGTLLASSVVSVNCLQVRMISYVSGSAQVTITVANSVGGQITSPLDGSGNVKVSCQSGCAGGGNVGISSPLDGSGYVLVNGSNVTQPVSGAVTATGSGNFTVVQATGTNLHTVCDSGCGAAPPYSYTTVTGTGAVVVKSGSGTFAGLHNLATASQTSGMTCIWYDNTAASGNILYESGPLGSGQVVTFAGGQGVRFGTGLTVQCSGGTPLAPGILTLWI